MSDRDLNVRLSEEVTRATFEAREAMSAMAQRCELPHPLMSLSLLIDRSKVAVDCWEDDASFKLDPASATITFNAKTLVHLLEASDSLADEIGYDDDEERARVIQLAVNLFVIHELIHIVQNFPDFASVSAVKAGLPTIGLPMLDVGADIIAAWVCANVEAERLGQRDKDDILATYASMLVLAYGVGAFVFDVKGRAPKTQRALGLLVSALLVRAKLDGTLVTNKIYDAWTPQSPLFVMDAQSTDVLNAMVIDKVPGMLVDNFHPDNPEGVRQLWNSVGEKPVLNTLVLLGAELMRIGVIQTR